MTHPPPTIPPAWHDDYQERVSIMIEDGGQTESAARLLADAEIAERIRRYEQSKEAE